MRRRRNAGLPASVQDAPPGPTCSACNPAAPAAPAPLRNVIYNLLGPLPPQCGPHPQTPLSTMCSCVRSLPTHPGAGAIGNLAGGPAGSWDTLHSGSERPRPARLPVTERVDPGVPRVLSKSLYARSPVRRRRSLATSLSNPQ